MTFPFFDHDRDLPPEFPVSLLGNTRLGFDPRIEAAANVEERHARVGQRGQIIERLCFRRVAAQNGILTVDATDFVRVRNRPSVGIASRSPCAFHDPQQGRPAVGGADSPSLESLVAIAWDDAARERMSRIPAFVRGMVMRAVEDSCRKDGRDRVTIEALEAIRSRMPMPKVFGRHE